MGNFRARKCHKCKHTLKRKNLVELKNGKAVCDMHKKGIPEDIFFKGKSCKHFELAHKYNLLDMMGNVAKKISNKGKVEGKDKTEKQKNNRVISINKNIN